MASSPPGGYHTPLPNPKKRPSISAQSSTISVKKARLSHPLRQTSFPASDATAFYASAGPSSARSETGSIAASTFSNTTSTSKPAPRGRGRPRKSTTIHADDNSTANGNDGQSQSERRGARSVVSANNANNNADDDAGDEEDDIAHYATSTADALASAAYEEAQTQRRDRLKSVLDPNSLLRFERWRSAILNKSTVRRLVNQIVSQSVTENPIQAVRVYAKWYVAEIVERAREVQSEAAVAQDETIAAEKEDRKVKLEALQSKLRIEEAKPDGERISEYDRRRLIAQIEKARREAEEYIPNQHRGGLLPDHLREALRRYRADGEGGGTGFEGQSHPLLGAQGSKVWSGDGAVGGGGGRLFR